MKSIHILLCLLFVCLFGCSSESEDQQEVFMVIPVNPNTKDELRLEDIASEIEAVKLEETEESLITYVAKVMRTEDFIFVLDLGLKKVLQFNNQGDFIKAIGKIGDGPEEIPMPTSFLVDKENNHVYIAGRSKIVVYDFEGVFVRSIGDFIIPNYLYLRDGSLEVFRIENKPAREGEGVIKVPTRFSVNPTTGEVLDSLELAEIELKNNIVFMVMDANYYSQSSNDEYFYLSVLFRESIVRDTLYRVSGRELIPSVKLDFGDKAISDSGSRAILIRDVFRSDRYLLSRYSFERKDKVFVYDFKDQKSYNVSGGINGGGYSDNEPVRLRALEGDANTYYFSAKKLEEGITEEPNPTLYFVKLKK